eukprot:3821642-Pleurochrysis_carterae.AAC.1
MIESSVEQLSRHLCSSCGLVISLCHDCRCGGDACRWRVAPLGLLCSTGGPFIPVWSMRDAFPVAPCTCSATCASFASLPRLTRL